MLPQGGLKRRRRFILEAVGASVMEVIQSSPHEPVSEMFVAFRRQTVEKSVLQNYSGRFQACQPAPYCLRRSRMAVRRKFFETDHLENGSDEIVTWRAAVGLHNPPFFRGYKQLQPVP